jgi:hypothetical protein
VEEPTAEEFRVEVSPGMPGREADDMPVDETSPAADSNHDLMPSEADAGPAEDILEAELYLGDESEEEEHSMDTRILEPIPAEGEIRVTATPWLDEVSEGRPGDSLEWPVHEERDLQHRERIDTPRVRHLFPVPDSDWDVSHLEFTHFGRGSDAS